MVNVNYKVTWLDELLKKFWKVKVNETLNTWIKKSIIYMEGVAKKETPVDKGFLRNAFRSEFSNLEGRLYNTKKYAPFVHEGTSPYVIVAKKKRALSDGKTMFWKKVNHPWIKSNPFMTRAKDKWEDKVIQILNKEILNALQM